MKSNGTVDIYGTKEKKPPKRHKDKLKHVRIPLQDEYLKRVRLMAKAQEKTVTDIAEALLMEVVERDYLWQINILAKDYEADAKHSVQAWLPPQIHDILFELSVEYLSSVRHVAYSLLVHSLKTQGGAKR